MSPSKRCFWSLGGPTGKPGRVSLWLYPELKYFGPEGAPRSLWMRISYTRIVPVMMAVLIPLLFCSDWLFRIALEQYLKVNLTPSISDLWLLYVGRVTVFVLGTCWGYALAGPLVRRELRRALRARGIIICPKCAYDLTGLTTDHCPECGTPIPPHEQRA